MTRASARRRGQATRAPSTSNTAEMKSWLPKRFASSALKKFFKREEWVAKPPAKQARSVPKHGRKTVTDARNEYHAIPLRPEDRHLTAFRPKLRPKSQWTNALQAAFDAGKLEIVKDIKASVGTLDQRLPICLRTDSSKTDETLPLPEGVQLRGHRPSVLHRRM